MHLIGLRFNGAVAALLFLCSWFSHALAAHGELPARTYRIGVMAISRPGPENPRVWNAFLAGLRELGYVEGQNIAFEWRYSEGHTDRFPELARDLVGSNVDLILVYTTPAALAAKAATSTIPILFATAIDPVGAGLAQSLARPGGNVTGLATLSTELSGKRLELLSEIRPRLSKVALLLNEANPANLLTLQQTEDAARHLRIALQSHRVRAPEELAAKFAEIASQHPDGLFVLGDAVILEHRREIADFALQAHLPSSFESREMVIAGGLLAYGPDYAEMFRRAASYADKLLKGVKPADLPFEQASKFELVINMKTARILGLKLPQSLLHRADEILE